MQLVRVKNCILGTVEYFVPTEETLEMSMDDDEKEVGLKTWNKMVTSIHTEGYREGSSAGKDMSFQDGFDSGYRQGFQNGFKLGVHNGILSFLDLNLTSFDASAKSTLSTIKQHEEPLKGLCVLCTEKEATEEIGERTVLEVLSAVKQHQDKSLSDAEKQNKTDELRSLLKYVYQTDFDVQ